MPCDWPDPKSVIPLVEQVLQNHQKAISEYEFLSELATRHPFFAEKAEATYSLNLFQRHFLLFHCLYVLEQQYQANGTGQLVISALEIRLLPAINHTNKLHSSALTTPDSVRDYYLDFSNFENTGANEVDELLGKFWLALARHDARADALRLLGLTDPVNDNIIRRKYRELVMQHHPDRGGNIKIIQQLNSAISKLLPKSSA
ncbi:MAG: DNA-J related domain-containing protein [Thioalkalispiraceae bacterium]|jgi:hypothetical protein